MIEENPEIFKKNYEVLKTAVNKIIKKNEKNLSSFVDFLVEQKLYEEAYNIIQSHPEFAREKLAYLDNIPVKIKNFALKYLSDKESSKFKIINFIFNDNIPIGEINDLHFRYDSNNFVDFVLTHLPENEEESLKVKKAKKILTLIEENCVFKIDDENNIML
ncbi:MAG: hypothetical protein PHN56_01650 [Candidatus Nanoarchaeia archaeon]|nr:hypothetical protein [Candidatus Nanoarchaeia archaeon]